MKPTLLVVGVEMNNLEHRKCTLHWNWIELKLGSHLADWNSITTVERTLHSTSPRVDSREYGGNPL